VTGDESGRLRADAIIVSLDCADKPTALRALADVATGIAGVPASLILERVLQREALGSTGFGQGVALPHARLDVLSRIVILVARLAKPIAYDALDAEPVDLLVLLLSPENAGADHLKTLALISRLFRNRDVLAAVRAAPDADAIRAAIERPALTASRSA